MSKPTSAQLCWGGILVLFLGLQIPSVARAATPLLPCSDPSGCPDLIVDVNQLKHWKIETRTFSSTDCAVVEGETQAGTQ